MDMRSKRMKLTTGSMPRNFLFLLFILAVLYWLYFVNVSGYKHHALGIFTQIPLILIPITGGLTGLIKSRRWGGHKSAMGRALLSLSSGMTLWGIALGMWTYYIATGIAIPYPSLADYVFIWSPILWVYGLLQLAKAVGTPFGFRTTKQRLVGIGVTAAVSLFAYYFLVVVAHGNTLGTPDETTMQLFFDYAYTLETLVTVILVGTIFFLSRKYLGGRYKNPVLFLFVGFFIHFLAIFFFVRTTGDGSYFNGNIADVLFTLAVYMESLGIINLDPQLT
jgi:hypothetical protein